MANTKHVEILRKGVSHWNKWREENESVKPNLAEAHLTGLYLVEANFYGANLTKTKLNGANLTKTNLTGADLTQVHLFQANLEGAKLDGAKLGGAILTGANLRRADLSGANLRGAKLIDAIFNGCALRGTDFTECILGNTVFSYVNMKGVIGLETMIHVGPSSIGIETIYISEGKIPEVFIRDCGVPDSFIAYIPSLVGAGLAIQFYSCFISYSTQDEEFAERLHSRMRQANMRVWFAPKDMKGGEKLNEQIESAIHLNDRLLIVLSENSMRSKWVVSEIRRARVVEKKENRRKLFPIRLVEYKTIEEWEKLNPNIDAEIAEEIRSYYIPGFANWKNHDSFEKAFEGLYNDLKFAGNKIK